jgi:phenylacetate-coenzyme A ligase PaaK-like adenylate-forming protein
MSLLQTLRFAGCISKILPVPQWKPEKLERLRQKRLRQIVNLAIDRSPFYREKFRGIDRNRFQLTDLPTTNKTELMAHFDQTVTDREVRQADVERFVEDPDNLGRWFLGRYAVSHTSGSQGQPMLILQDRKALEIFFALMCSRANPAGTPGILQGISRLLNPVRVAIVTMRRGSYPSGSAIEFMPELVGNFVRIKCLSSLQADLVDQLNAFQPNVLVSYASVLEALSLRSEQLALKTLRQIANISEQLTARARSRVEKAFGVPLPDHYAVGECLLLANGCQTGSGSHVNADWAILEVVDENYQPVAPGQLGRKILVTNLANTVQPFIRYEVGDQLQVTEGRCTCGSRLPKIAHVEGRAAEIFWIFDGSCHRMVHAALFHTVLDALGSIREWQAIQRERNRLELRLELLPNSTFCPDTGETILRRMFQENGLPPDVTVDVQIVPHLAPDPVTNKFRRMQSEVGPPDDLKM